MAFIFTSIYDILIYDVVSDIDILLKKIGGFAYVAQNMALVLYKYFCKLLSISGQVTFFGLVFIHKVFIYGVVMITKRVLGGTQDLEPRALKVLALTVIREEGT